LKRLLAVPGVLSLVLLGCQSTGPASKPGPPPAPVVEFNPAYYRAAIQAEDARYPDLFASDSHALWIGREVAAVKWDAAIDAGASIDPLLQSDAVAVTEDFIVIECHIASAFGDTSIAYDVAGFRGIAPYLELPDGSKIEPVQQTYQGRLAESQQGALKRFERIIVLVFPKRDLWVRQPTLVEGTASVKLVLKSIHGDFAFVWPALPVAAPPPGLTREEAVAAAKVGFQELYGGIRRLSRLFR
jgi:hypothetical protein